MPFPNDPTPSIVGRELLGPQTGRTVIQGLPDFDPVAFLERAKTKAAEPSADVISDESSLPEDEDPAPLLDLSSEGPIGAQWRRQASRGEQTSRPCTLCQLLSLWAAGSLCISRTKPLHPSVS